MANKTFADRIAEAFRTGKEAKFYATDETSTGTEYEFTPTGLSTFLSGLAQTLTNKTITAPVLTLQSYTVATLPATTSVARLIYVSDGTTNKRLAVSDGTNWRFPDGNVVS